MNPHRDDVVEPPGIRPLRFRPRNERLSVWLGYGVSQVLGLGALMIVALTLSHFDFTRIGLLGPWLVGILICSQLFFIPFGTGVIAAYFWLDERELTREDNDRPHDLKGSVVVNVLIACVGTWKISWGIAMGLVFTLPLLSFFMWLGTRMGARFWRANPFLDGISPPFP